jgi:hypothetical protein
MSLLNLFLYISYLEIEWYFYLLQICLLLVVEGDVSK